MSQKMSQKKNTVLKPLRVTSIAESMGVSERAVQKWITKGLKGGRTLKATRAGTTGMWRVDPEDLEDFLTTNR